MQRFENVLESMLIHATQHPCPPILAEGMRSAVFAGGGRVRPRLLTEVAIACGDKHPTLTDAAAAALELMHCASLVHDDLPAFDNAQMRRGQATVQAAYGEQIAVLTGDALIVLAFETLAQAALSQPSIATRLLRVLARAGGAPYGISAGQAWESEAKPDIEIYHTAKSASLFEAACVAGAISAGADGENWRALGTHLGAAYQTADDLADACGTDETIGKPTQQDQRNQVPNMTRELGIASAQEKLSTLLEQAKCAVPECQGRQHLYALVDHIGTRLLPTGMSVRREKIFEPSQRTAWAG